MLDIPSVNQIVANTRDVTQRKKTEDQTKKITALLAEAQHIAETPAMVLRFRRMGRNRRQRRPADVWSACPALSDR